MPIDSEEALQAMAVAQSMATAAGEPPSSTHVLLALFCFPNRARALFAERNLAEAHIRAALLDADAPPEPHIVFNRLQDRARDVAQNVGAEKVDCLHYVVAISRLREAEAYRVLERTGVSLSTLRNSAVGSMTSASEQARMGGRPRARLSSVAVLPDASVGTNRAATTAEAAAAPCASAPLPIAPGASHANAPLAGAAQAAPPPVAPRAELLADSAKALYDVPPPQARQALPHTAAPPGDNADSDADCATDASHDPSAYALEDLAPALAECGTDLRARARSGSLDRAVGRERELDALADVLGKRRANNPVLVGPPGVGKTAIVEGLALAWAELDPLTQQPRDSRRIVALDTGAMVAGTSLRGSFSERLSAIKNEVAAARGHLVVFIDELHTLIGAGASGEGPQDAAGELKAALARGEFPCIGATTDDEFKRYIERDPALERRFTSVLVDEPSCALAQTIVQASLAPYEEHHRVTYTDDAVRAAVLLSHRFVTERKLPDKAFAVLDLAGSRCHRRGKAVVERVEVARVVHEWSGVPLERLVETDAHRFARAESHLAERLVGHSHVISAVAQALRRGFAGFNGKRPMGSFLFLGPTGVGKTEMVKVLAEFVFGQRDAIVRFDMSELAEKHAVARLLGAQPGYVGYDEGGQLTEALRKRPFQIVLFDEIEKAHPDVLNVLLQLLDEGHLTDAQGRRISFANTLVVLTSNLGADALARAGGIGFSGKMDAKSREANCEKERRNVAEAARLQLTPELWSRLDEHLVFLPLQREEVERIALAQLRSMQAALAHEREVALAWDDDVIAFLLDHGGFSTTTGARGLRQALQRHVEAAIAEMILSHALKPPCGIHLRVNADGDSLALQQCAPAAPESAEGSAADANPAKPSAGRAKAPRAANKPKAGQPREAT